MNTNADRISPRERRVLLATCFTHFMSHVNVLAFPALVLPLSRSLDMEISGVMDLSFLMYLLYGLSAIMWGAAADRWSASSLLRLFPAGCALSCFAAAWAIGSPRQLSICLAALGFFSGIYHPVGLGYISQTIRRVSRGFAWNGIFGNLGVALAPLAAGALVWLHGPAACYVFLGSVNLLGLFFVRGLRDPGTGMHEDEPVPAPSSGHLKGFVILLGIMMLGGIVYRGATLVLPAFVELRSMSAVRSLFSFDGTAESVTFIATVIASVIYLFGILGQYSGGRVAERYDLRYCYLCFHLVPACAAFCISAAYGFPLVGCAAVYFFFLLGMQPIENTLVARLASDAFRHSAYGAKFVLTFGVGSLSVKMISVIEHRYGMAPVFVMLGAVSCLLVMGILLLISRTRPQMSS